MFPHMETAKPLPEPQNPLDAAFIRIGAAKGVLLQIKKWQAVDGAPDFPPTIGMDAKDYLKLLCDAGFIRRVKTKEGGFPYRITWKGLCFLDTHAVLDCLGTDKTNVGNSVQDVLVALAAFSFH